MRTTMRLRTGFGDSDGETARAFRAFKPALYGQKRRMLAALGFAMALTALELLRPWPIKWVIDALTGTAVPSDRQLIGFAVLAFAVPAGIGLVNEQLQIAVAKVSRKATVRIRSDVFEHLHRIELNEHKTRHSGDLLMRLMGDVNMVRDLLFPSWITIVTRVSVLLGAVVIFITVDWRLFLLALIPLPLLSVRVGRTSKKVKRAAGKQRRKEGNIAATAAEALRRIDLTKAFGAEQRTTASFTRDARGAERATMAATRHAAELSRTTEVLTGLGVGLVLAFGSLRVRGGFLTPGELLVSMSYTRLMYKPIRKLTAEAARLAKATACSLRVLDILEIPIESATVGDPAPPFAGAIRLTDVHHFYPDGRRSLNGLSVSIPSGALVAVAGDNGSGKSTLIALLLRLYRPSTGEISIDGIAIESLRLDTYRAQIAYVPQELSLFSGTIRENIAFGRPDATDAEIEAAAEMAVFDQVVATLPDRYETVLEEAGRSLSGGQARRLMLARAALRDAPIVLLDEPLAGLDPEARVAVINAIQNLARGRTMLVVSHDDVEKLGATHRIRLDNGRLLEPDHVGLP